MKTAAVSDGRAQYICRHFVTSIDITCSVRDLSRMSRFDPIAS